MGNPKDITQQILRSILVSYFKVAAIVGAMVSIGVWGFGKWDYLYLGIGLLVFGAVQGYVGQYIPLRNKHDSLLNKYGDVYVDEVNKAIARYGIRKLTSTRWFETYADEFCERNKLGGAIESIE